MRIAIWADDESWILLGLSENENRIRVKNNLVFPDNNINGFIQLVPFMEDQYIPDAGNKPYFINDVGLLSAKLNHPSIIPFNGWKGFIEKEYWEMAGKLSDGAMEVLSLIHRKALVVPQTPGMVSPKVISMIINEAWFALDEKVSSKEEIDTAMKLGTNYPLGPFEWADQIGIKNIYYLLKELEKTDPLYTPAPLLIKAAIS